MTTLRQSLRKVNSTAARALLKAPNRPKTWAIEGQAGILQLTATAHTKSEARAQFKKFHKVKRLPPGTRLIRLPGE